MYSQAGVYEQIPNLSVLNTSQLHPFTLQAQIQHQHNAAHVQQTHGVSHAPAETSQIENLHKGARPIGVDSAINTSERVAQLHGRSPAQQMPYNPHLAPFVSQMINAQQPNLAAASATRLYHNGMQHAAFQFPDQANSNAYAAGIMNLIPGGFMFAPGGIYEQLQPQNPSTAMPKQPEQRKDDQRTE